PGDVRPWQNLDDVEIVALHDWSASRLRIAELDLKGRVVKFTAYPVYRIGHWFKDGRNPYFAENVREAFGRPGQWYLDRPAGTLTYRPLPGEQMGQLTVVAPRTDVLVTVTGDLEKGAYVEHVVFRGLLFSHTHWTLPAEGYSSRQGMIDLPSAVDLKAARHCRFEGCTLAHLGGYAMRLGSGCHDNQVIGNRFFDLGGGGVMVGVTSRNSPPPVTPTGNRVANNVISDGGLVHYSAHGVWIGIAAGTEVSHNVIRRFLYSNVSVGWSWNDQPTECRENVIQYNHIHDAMMLLADGGGIYSLGLQPGTVIRGNLIHAVHRSRFAGRAENNGIFFDQGTKQFLVEGNVIYNTANKLIRYNQSREDWNTFRRNTLGVGPDDPQFPKAAAAKAGLQPRYRRLDAQPVKVTPTPILSMEIPSR
ncbi:MAG: right-handed parallel beta-helix repeat-containing protein, partial [Planctomycetota bacterium]